MSLFSTPKAPQEDPAVKAARERQTRLAENDLTGRVQEQVRRRTRQRIQIFGGGAASPINSSPLFSTASAPLRD